MAMAVCNGKVADTSWQQQFPLRWKGHIQPLSTLNHGLVHAHKVLLNDASALHHEPVEAHGTGQVAVPWALLQPWLNGVHCSMWDGGGSGMGQPAWIVDGPMCCYAASTSASQSPSTSGMPCGVGRVPPWLAPCHVGWAAFHHSTAIAIWPLSSAILSVPGASLALCMLPCGDLLPPAHPTMALVGLQYFVLVAGLCPSFMFLLQKSAFFCCLHPFLRPF